MPFQFKKEKIQLPLRPRLIVYVVVVAVLCVITALVWNKQDPEILMQPNKSIYTVGEPIYVTTKFKNRSFQFVKVSHGKQHAVSIGIFDSNGNLVGASPQLGTLEGVAKLILPFASHSFNPEHLLQLDNPGDYKLRAEIYVKKSGKYEPVYKEIEIKVTSDF